MKILDRYVARQYLTNILSLYVILFAFVVTIDVAMNLDHFWRMAGEKQSPAGEMGVVRQFVLFAFVPCALPRRRTAIILFLEPTVFGGRSPPTVPLGVYG